MDGVHHCIENALTENDESEHRAEVRADDVARSDDLDGASDSALVIERNDFHGIIPPRDRPATASRPGAQKDPSPGSGREILEIVP